MHDEQKYLLDKLLGRIDFYIDTVNSKVAFLIAFDTFILGAVSLNFRQLKSGITNQIVVWFASALFLAILLGVSLSLYFALKAVAPYLEGKPKGESLSYISLLFFGSVAKQSIDDFRNRVCDIDSIRLREDLINQTYLLSNGLNMKFINLNKSIFWAINGVLIPVFLLASLVAFSS
jgi:Family of unknown function (DUF5706)